MIFGEVTAIVSGVVTPREMVCMFLRYDTILGLKKRRDKLYVSSKERRHLTATA